MAAVAVLILGLVGVALDVIDGVIGPQHPLLTVVILPEPILAATGTPDPRIQYRDRDAGPGDSLGMQQVSIHMADVMGLAGFLVDLLAIAYHRHRRYKLGPTALGELDD